MHSPTWVRRGERAGEVGRPVSLVMALEDEPASRHAGMVSDHRDVLVGQTGLANGLLARTTVDAAERRDVGYNLVVFAAELASALGWLAEHGRVDPRLRRDCADAVAAATLAAAACLAATIMRHQAGRG